MAEPSALAGVFGNVGFSLEQSDASFHVSFLSFLFRMRVFLGLMFDEGWGKNKKSKIKEVQHLCL